MSKQARGFTLLELLLAISIFSVIAVVAYSGLNTALQNQHRATEYAQRTAALQWTMQGLQQDVMQMLNRPIRNQWGEREAALLGQHQQFTFTHNGGAGHSMLRQQPRSQLQRVAYQIRDGVLTRLHWQSVDRAQDTHAISQDLISQVTEFSLRYLDAQRQWQEQWIMDEKNPNLPKAIEISLEFSDMGKIQRLFELTEAVIYPVIAKAENKKTDEHQ